MGLHRFLVGGVDAKPEALPVSHLCQGAMHGVLNQVGVGADFAWMAMGLVKYNLNLGSENAEGE